MSDNGNSLSGLQSSEGNQFEQLIKRMDKLEKDNQDTKTENADIKQKYEAIKQENADIIQKYEAIKTENAEIKNNLKKLIPTAKHFAIGGTLGGLAGLATAVSGGLAIGGLKITALIVLGAAGGIAGIIITVSAIAIFSYRRKICETLKKIWLAAKARFKSSETKVVYDQLDQFCQENVGMKLE